MKKIYILFTAMLIGSQISKAQLTLTYANNAPVVGDVYTKVGYDSTTVIPKAMGSGQSWNFTSLAANSNSGTTTYTTVAASPAASLFATANLASQRGNNDWEYWNTQSAALSYVGQANPSNTSAAVFSNQGTWITWPLTLNGNGTDNFSAIEASPTSTTNWSGSISFTATGAGTVTLPNGNVHTNCLQVRKNIVVNMVGSINGTMTMVQYDYWSSTSKFPIVTIEYNTQATASTTNTGVDININANALTTGINSNTAEQTTFVVYPNPAKDVINVALFDLTTADKIEILDVTGKFIKSVNGSNSINTSSLSKGTYFIKVSTSKGSSQKQIIITE